MNTTTDINTSNLEYWLRGPVEGIPLLLQPAAHSILQSRREVMEGLKDFPESLVWERPEGVASVAFHLQHMPGVLDRMFTYAKGKQLDQHQLDYMVAEGKENDDIKLSALLDHLNNQVEKALEQLRDTPENVLLEHRAVGRKQVPSNVIGLLFHGAEHIQRHTGQLLVTSRVVNVQW
ncbi:MAG: DinB family protein [Chitinophagaceae bacterium]|nr:DinB family protein [Chitinophagaceae bacterium]